MYFRYDTGAINGLIQATTAIYNDREPLPQSDSQESSPVFHAGHLR